MANPTNKTNKKAGLILASASAGRLELLRQIGVEPDHILPADLDETKKSNEKVVDYVTRLADEKTEFIRSNMAKGHGLNPDDFYLIGGDTAVAKYPTEILDKTMTVDEARATLTWLSGRRHTIYSGLCVIAPNGRKSVKTAKASVKMGVINDQALERYLESGEWRGKAGGYMIRGRIAQHIQWIKGSHTAIIGLPLYELRNSLIGLGYRYDQQT
jgi:septum formation protein